MCLQVSKVIERLFNHRLLQYLKDRQLISDRQYGFRIVVRLVNYLCTLRTAGLRPWEGKGVALPISLDIAKAFDRVWCKALQSKLPSYRIHEGLCR